VALLIDNDGVLANAHDVLIKKYQDLGYPVERNHIDAWSFGRFAKMIGKTPKEILDEDFFPIWVHQQRDIGLMDSSVPDVVNYLLSTYDASIVTANDVSQVRPWLLLNGITDKHLVEHWHNKADLDYRVIVEDNPDLRVYSHQVLVMRDQPWNQTAKPHCRFRHSEELLTIVEHYCRMGLVSRR